MPIDPKANSKFFEANQVQFKTGAVIWVQGVQFTVVSSDNNQLLLRPVTAKIS